MPSPAVPAPPPRARRRVGALLALVVAVVGLVAACASTPEQDELVDALVRAGLTETEAECAAEALYDNLDDDQIGAIAERGPSAVIDDVDDPDEPIDVARREIAACRTSADPTTTTPGAEGSTTTTAGGATTMPIEGEGSTTLGPGTSLPKEPLGTPTTVRPAD